MCVSQCELVDVCDSTFLKDSHMEEDRQKDKQKSKINVGTESKRVKSMATFTSTSTRFRPIVERKRHCKREPLRLSLIERWVV